jgi:hypothetical protein
MLKRYAKVNVAFVAITLWFYTNDLAISVMIASSMAEYRIEKLRRARGSIRLVIRAPKTTSQQ